jgi:hypothetical protein
MASQTFNANDTWVCPTGVTEVTAEVWGGGGAGGGLGPAGPCHDRAAGGGAGGAYAKRTFTVTPGNSYTVTVAATKTGTATSTAADNTGNPSWFISNDSNGCVAVGGPGAPPWSTDDSGGPGATGTKTGCVGDVTVAGGNGSSAQDTGQGAAGGAGANGGGAGGAAQGFSDGPGSPGTAPGGGGGGAGQINDGDAGIAGGSGAAGRIVLTWTISSQNFSASGADTETLQDSVSAVAAYSRPQSEVEDLHDAVASVLDATRSYAEDVTLADTASLVSTRPLSDVLTASDSFTTNLFTAWSENVSDTISLDDRMTHESEVVPVYQYTAYVVRIGV